MRIERCDSACEDDGDFWTDLIMLYYCMYFDAVGLLDVLLRATTDIDAAGFISNLCVFMSNTRIDV